MYVMSEQRIREEKIAQLKKGLTAYVESREMIRLMKRRIDQEKLEVHYDDTNIGCWIIPLSGQMKN